MDADLFIYGIDSLGDEDELETSYSSQSDFTEVSKMDATTTIQNTATKHTATTHTTTPMSTRKFGTNLTHSSIGNHHHLHHDHNRHLSNTNKKKAVLASSSSTSTQKKIRKTPIDIGRRRSSSSKKVTTTSKKTRRDELQSTTTTTPSSRLTARKRGEIGHSVTTKNKTKTARNLELEGSLKRAEQTKNDVGTQSSSLSRKIVSSLRSKQRQILSSPAGSSSAGTSGVVGAAAGASASAVNVGVETTVHFESGRPIGIKLEPVVKSGDKEFGCRVMRFVDSTITTTTTTNEGELQQEIVQSQARLSGKIHIGDVVTAIDGRVVTSKSYSDIVKIFKMPVSVKNGRDITFKSVPKSSSSSSVTSSSSATPMTTLSSSSSSNGISKDRLETSEVVENVELSSIRDQSNLSKNMTTAQVGLQSSQSQSSIYKKHTTTTTATSTRKKRQQRQVFSPSFVKKMSLSTVKDRSILFSPEDHDNRNNNEVVADDEQMMNQSTISTATNVSNVLSTVMKNIVPNPPATTAQDMSGEAEGVVPASTLTKKIGWSLTGSSSKQFDKAALMKMELLAELSYTKAALGDNEENLKKMERTIEGLAMEKKMVQDEKKMTELKLNEIQREKSTTESIFKEKSHQYATSSAKQGEELRLANLKIEETTSQINTLAKQNGILRAQYEQLKVQSHGRENELTRQIVKANGDFQQEVSSVKVLEEQIAQLQIQSNEKDKKLQTVSNELMERTLLLDERVNASRKLEETTSVQTTKLEETIRQLREREEMLTSTATSEKVQVQNEISRLSHLLKGSEEQLEKAQRLAAESLEEKEHLIMKLQAELEEKDKVLESERQRSAHDEGRHNVQFQDAQDNLSQANENLAIECKKTSQLSEQMQVQRQDFERRLQEEESKSSTKLLQYQREVAVTTQEKDKNIILLQGQVSRTQDLLSDAQKTIENLEGEKDKQEGIFKERESGLYNIIDEQKTEISSLAEKLDVQQKNFEMELEKVGETNEVSHANLHQALTQSLKDKEDEIEQLQGLLIAERQTNLNKEGKIVEQLNECQKKLQIKEDGLRKVVESLEFERREALQAAERAECVKADLERGLEVEQEKIKEIYGNFESHLSDLNDENAVMRDKLQGEINNRQTELESIQALYDELRSEQTSLLSKSNEASAQFEAKEQSLLRDIELLESEIERLSHQLNDQEGQFEQKLREEQSLLKDIELLKSETESLRHQLNDQEMQFEQKLRDAEEKGNSDNLCNAQKAFSESVKEKEDVIDKLQNEIEMKQDLLETERNEKESLLVKEGMLVSELSDIKESLESKNKDLCKISDELEAMRKEALERENVEKQLEEAEANNLEKIEALQQEFRDCITEKDEIIQQLQSNEELAKQAHNDLMNDLSKIGAEKSHQEGGFAKTIDYLEAESENLTNQLNMQQESFQLKLKEVEKKSLSEIQNLRDALAQSAKEKEDFIDKLQGDIEQKQGMLEAERKAKDEILRKEANLIEDYDTMQSDLNRKEQELRNSVSILEAERDEAVQQIKIQREKYENKVQDEGKKSQDLQREISIKQDSLGKVQKSCDEMKSEIIRLQSESEGFASQLNEQQKNFEEKLKLVEVKGTGTHDSLQKAFSESVKEKEDFIEKLQGEIEQKQDLLEAEREAKNQMLSKESTLISQVNELQSDLTQKENDLREAADCHESELQEALQRIQSQKEDFETQLQEERRKALDHSDRIEKLQHEITMKQGSLEIAQKLCDDMKSEIARLQSESETSTIQFNEQVKNFEAKLKSAEEKNSGNLLTLQQTFSESVKEKEDFIEKLQGEIEEKQDLLEAERKAKDDLIVELEILQKKEGDISKLTESLEAELKIASQRISEQEEEYESQLRDEEAKVMEKTDLIEILQSEIAVKEDLLEAVHETNNDMKSENDRLLAQLNDQELNFKGKVDELHDTIDKLEIESDDLTRRLDAQKLSFEAKQTEIEETTELIQDMEKSYSDSLAEKQVSIEKLQDDVRNRDMLLDTELDMKTELLTKQAELALQIEEVQQNLQNKEACLQNLTKNFEIERMETSQQIDLQRESFERRLHQECARNLEKDSQIEELQNGINASTKETIAITEKLKDELKTKEGLLDNLHKSCETLTKERMDLQSQVNDQHDVRKSLVAKLEEHERRAEQTDREISLANDHVHQLENDLESLERTKKDEINGLRRELSTMEKEMSDANWENSLLLEKKQEEIQSALVEIDSLSGKLREAEVPKETLRLTYGQLSRICRDMKLINIDSDKCVDEKEMTAEAIEEYIGCLRDGIKDSQSNALAGFELANSRERAVSRLERTVRSKERDIESLNKENEKLKLGIDEMKSLQKESKSKTLELESKLKEMDSKKNSISSIHEKKCDQLLIDIERKSNEIQELQLTNSRSREEIHELKTVTLRSKERDIRGLKKENKELKSGIDKVKSVSETRRSELELQLKDMDSEMKSMSSMHQKECNQLLDEIEEQSNEIRELQSSCSQCEEEINELKSYTLRSKDEDIENLDRECKRLKMSLDEMKSSHDESKSKNLDLESRLKEMRNKMRSMSSSHDKECDELVNDINTKSTQIKELQSLNSQTLAKMEELKAVTLRAKEQENSTLRSENEKLKANINEMNSSHSESKSTQSALELKLNELDSKMKNMTLIHDKECNQLLDEIDEKTDEIKELQSTIQQTKEDMDEMKQATLRSTGREVRNLKSENKKLKVTIDEMKSLHDETETKRSEMELKLKEMDSKMKNMSLIHDKECNKLLDEIDEKSDKMKELQSLHSQTQEEKESTLKSTEEEIQCLKEENSALKITIDDMKSLQTEIKSRNSEFESKLKEMDSKMKEIAILHEKECTGLLSDIDAKSNEIKELQSSNNLKEEEIAELKTSLFHVESNSSLSGDSTLSNDNATDLFSPGTAEVVSKQSDLISDLTRLKTKIHNAITPVKKDSDALESNGKNDTNDKEGNHNDTVLISMEKQIDLLLDDIAAANKALEEKDASMKEMTESVKNLEMEKKEVGEKWKQMQGYVSQMEEALCHELKRRRQIEKEYTSFQKDTRVLASNYKSQMEKAAKKIKDLRGETHETTKTNDKDVRKAAGARLLFQSIDSKMKQRKGQAFRQWACETSKSKAIAEQVDVARQMAVQLETTKEKISALKCHLKREGMLNEDDLKSLTVVPKSQEQQQQQQQQFSPINTSLAQVNVRGAAAVASPVSNTSLCWSVSTDDEEEQISSTPTSTNFY